MQVVMGVGVALAVLGSLKQGEQNAQMYESQQAADRYNAAVKRQQADNVLAVANQREEQQRRNARLDEGRRSAAIAQSGTGFDGSNADVDRQSQIFAETDALNIRYQGTLDANSILNGATLDDYYANVAGKNAKNTRQNSYLAAASTALMGAGNVMKMGMGTSPAPAPSVGSPYDTGYSLSGPGYGYGINGGSYGYGLKRG